MRIGIDIDGVLTDIEQWQLDYSTKFYYENYKKDFMKIIKKSKTGTKNQKIKTKCFRKYREIL